jgi:hypothetical protein
MTKSAFKKRILRVLDPGKKNRGVLSIQPSGAVEINTDRILSSPRGRGQARTIERIATKHETEPA